MASILITHTNKYSFLPLRRNLERQEVNAALAAFVSGSGNLECCDGRPVPGLLTPKNLDLPTPVADLGRSLAWPPNGRIAWALALEYVSEMAVLVSSRPDICDTGCGRHTRTQPRLAARCGGVLVCLRRGGLDRVSVMGASGEWRVWECSAYAELRVSLPRAPSGRRDSCALADREGFHTPPVRWSGKRLRRVPRRTCQVWAAH